MVLPAPDEPAYDGSRVVKTTTYSKGAKTRVSGIKKVKQTIDSLNATIDKRLTIDAIDVTSKYSVENQILVNKLLAAELRKEVLKLTTFLKNNS